MANATPIDVHVHIFSETTPIGGHVATGLLYCTACRLELWDSDAVFITQNLDVGKNVYQLDLHAYIGKKTNVGIPITGTLCS